jgi:putative DNA primase/helicase
MGCPPQKVKSKNPSVGNGHLPTVLDQARAYAAAGLSVIPICSDGSKAASVKWKPYQKEPPTDAELIWWFDSGRQGIATINGKVSGNAETVDFDAGALLEPWRELVEQQAPGLYDRLTICSTPRRPNGYHVRYRCSGVIIPGNTDLALEQETDPDTGNLLFDEKGRPKLKATIQTRGEGGYSIAPGTPGHCHPTGGTYKHISGPPLTELSDITPEEREILWTAARSFNRWVERDEVKDGPRPGTPGDRLRPGDDFNRRGPDFLEIMRPHGWELARQQDGVRHLRRPGKDGPGSSATLDFCKSKDGLDLLAVFSSNAYPFEIPPGKLCGCYSRFAVFAILNHGGDFAAAARELGRQGYGDQSPAGGPARCKGNKDSERKTYRIGPLVLEPGRPRATPSGKVVIPCLLRSAGKVVDRVTVSDSPSGRRDAAKLIGAHLGKDSEDWVTIPRVLAEIVADAVEALSQDKQVEGDTIAVIVRRTVPGLFDPTYRTERGVWSEARGCEVTRFDFINFVDTPLMDAVAGAVDAPVDANGNGNRGALLRAVKVELEILWTDLCRELPEQTAAAADSAAGRKFRQALTRLWAATRTFEVSKAAENANGEVASRASLIGRTKTQAKDYLDGGVAPAAREKWRPVQKHFDAWWRPYTDSKGEVRIALAMRWTLADQIGVELPGVTDQASLTTLGVRFGVLERDPPVPAMLSGGVTRLAVLSLSLTDDLLAEPLDDEEEEPAEPVQ